MKTALLFSFFLDDPVFVMCIFLLSILFKFYLIKCMAVIVCLLTCFMLNI